MNYTLDCPFLNHSSDYALGVEFGLLYTKMREKDEIYDYFTTENQDQICLLASRSGWDVVCMEIWNKHPEWTWFHLKKK